MKATAAYLAATLCCAPLSPVALHARNSLNTYWYQPHTMSSAQDARDLLQFLSPHFIPRETTSSLYTSKPNVVLDKASESNFGLNLSFSLSGVEEKSQGLLSTSTTRIPWSEQKVVSFVYADISTFAIQNWSNDTTPSPWCVVPQTRGPVGPLLCVPTWQNAEQVIDALATLMAANGHAIQVSPGMLMSQPTEKELRKHPERAGCDVYDVFLGGPPAHAGIQPGDILQNVNGALCTDDSLTAEIGKAASKPDGDVVHMEVLRHDRPIQLDVRYPHFSVDVAALQKQVADPPRQHGSPAGVLPSFAAAPAAPTFHLGISARTITDSDLASTGLSRAQGVIVTHVEKGSLADQMQLQVGDVIQQANGADITDLTAIAQLIRSGAARSIRVWRKGKTLDLTIPQSM